MIHLLRRRPTLVVENAFEIHMRSRDQLNEEMRKVKSNGFTAVGIAPSKKNRRMVQFESSLEQDFITLLEFDIGVASFREQPAKIAFRDGTKTRHYTPDFLVRFRKDWPVYKRRKPILFEVKHSKDLAANKEKYRKKFDAARRYAKANGFVFKVITEKEIRGSVYLENARFLSRYKKEDVDVGLQFQILDAMEALKTGTPSEVLAVASNDLGRRMFLVNALWKMVAVRLIGCDLYSAITMETKIWHTSQRRYEPKSPIR